MAGCRDRPLIQRRLHLVGGIVQGVGFRPFVFRLANELGLSGWVRNTPAGVELQIQGTDAALSAFDHAFASSLPPLAVVTSHTSRAIPTIAESTFTILPSAAGEADIQIAPDSAVCPDCLRELFDPVNRRYRYPFITCTNCGPRYSIITGIPYDRPKTTMSGFPLCPECLGEYGDPNDRRFHAQPIACHTCGPQVRLLDSSGVLLSERDAAILQSIRLLKAGAILAVKGIGGYHLAVDACHHAAVERLRERKKRDEKPFAVMAADLGTARKLGVMDDMEERLLSTPEAPIVIVKKRDGSGISPLIAPDNGWLGVMLPYAPLHHLLMRGAFTALIMTSGNISDEPVAFEDGDALQRLSGIADYVLAHNRPIHIRSDDSVMRVFQGRPLFYRRARGYAPRAVKLPFSVPPLLAVGAELKGAVCLAYGERAFLSQHIGDLQNDTTCDSFRHTIEHLSDILEIPPEVVASDLHPDYLSSIHAAESGLPVVKVQHHHAHLAACMADNGLVGEVIGIIFDGTGYGLDGTVWGGEFLTGGYDGFSRAAHFRPVHLPGGDAAVREPWRMALSYLYQAVGDEAFDVDHPLLNRINTREKDIFRSMLERGINSPLTSSCGRLFDAVAALATLRQNVSYDGQAAIELEALAEESDDCGNYSFRHTDHLQIDFSPLFPEILADLRTGTPTADIARRFHRTVADAAAAVCRQIAQSSGLDRVVLSGGVFQNRLVTEMLYTDLTYSGLQVFTHRLTPPNDGCIALGQAAVAGWKTIQRG